MAPLPPLALARRLARLTGLRRFRAVEPDAPVDAASVRFVCNLCGHANAVPSECIAREHPSCARCASTVRFRAIGHLVALELLGQPTALAGATRRADVTGIGLSDDARCASALAAAFAYENTYLHTKPCLDITRVPARRRGRYDFVIASDVFEHVVPPVSRAFAGARALLKPGGVLIFTVPYTLDMECVEHFPDLHDFRLARRRGVWRLHNRTADGRSQSFDNLVFHGGPGSTLEMRLFSRAALEREFAAAGFARVRVASEPCPAFGIEWPHPWSVPMVAYAS